MDDADAKPAQPPSPKPAKPAVQTREARLAAALRTNLRRRKSGRADKPPEDE